MPVSIAMPQRQKSTIDALNDGLGVISRAYELKSGFDKSSQDEADRLKKAALEKALKDPTSQQSAMARRVLQQSGVNVDENASAFDIQSAYGDTGKYAQQAQEAKLKSKFKSPQDQEVASLGKSIKEMQAEKLRKELYPTAQEKLAGLSGTDKARYDSAKMGVDSVDKMVDALNKGDNTFSIIGDNDYTMNRRAFEEALGRMQSGGAISKDEENRFRAMAPTWTDNVQIQQKKAANLQNEMRSRLATLGFPQETSPLIPNFGGAAVKEAKADDWGVKVGEIRKGHIYVGGDPRSEKAWAPIPKKGAN